MIDDHVKNLKHFKGKAYMYTSAHNLENHRLRSHQ